MKNTLIFACICLALGFTTKALGSEKLEIPECFEIVDENTVQFDLADSGSFKDDCCPYESYPETYSYEPCEPSPEAYACFENQPYFEAPTSPCCIPEYCDACLWNFVLSVDYLYWQPRSDELPYATDLSTTDVQLSRSDIIRIRPDYSSGVRLGLGVLSSCLDYWQFLAEWTHYNGTSKDNASAAVLVPTWLAPQGNPVATLAEAEYTLRFNIADFSLKRTYCLTNRLTIDPTIGIRGIWLDQNFNIFYSGGDLGAGLLAKNSIDLKGFGLRGGFATQWNLCYGFSFLGWSYVDLLWSRLEISQGGFQVSGATRSSIKDTAHTAIPMFEVFLGVAWEKTICSLNVRARLGWEEQCLLNAMQFNLYTRAERSDFSAHQTGNLTLGGLTAGASIKF